MNVLTHFFAGWALAEVAATTPRERAIVTWAAVAPDLDGLSIVADLGSRALGRPESDFYFRYHHMWTHGLPAAIVAGIVAGLLAEKRLRTAFLAMVSFHLHLLCDVLGSRGPTPSDIWPIGYLEPLSARLRFSWTGQWALNDWRNILFTVAPIALALFLGVRRGYSPVSLFSKKADAAVVATLRTRLRRVS